MNNKHIEHYISCLKGLKGKVSVKPADKLMICCEDQTDELSFAGRTQQVNGVVSELISVDDVTACNKVHTSPFLLGLLNEYFYEEGVFLDLNVDKHFQEFELNRALLCLETEDEKRFTGIMVFDKLFGIPWSQWQAKLVEVKEHSVDKQIDAVINWLAQLTHKQAA